MGVSIETSQQNTGVIRRMNHPSSSILEGEWTRPGLDLPTFRDMRKMKLVTNTHHF